MTVKLSIFVIYLIYPIWILNSNVFKIQFVSASIAKFHYNNDINETTERQYSKYTKRLLNWIEKSNSAVMGNSDLVFNCTIYGSIITSFSVEDVEENQIINTHDEDTIYRLDNIRNLTKVLPVDVVYWPPVFTIPCSSSASRHRSERGVSLAHFQIWKDFIHFDPKILQLKNNYNEGTSEYVYSIYNGNFYAMIQGVLYKNNAIYRHDDIMIILEDDAMSIVESTAELMAAELKKMYADIIFFGWCEGRMTRPYPLCLHSYAISREGAKKLVDYYEPCGPALDLQLVELMKNGLISYQTVRPRGYKSVVKDEFQTKKSVETRTGIFYQNYHKLKSTNNNNRPHQFN